MAGAKERVRTGGFFCPLWKFTTVIGICRTVIHSGPEATGAEARRRPSTTGSAPTALRHPLPTLVRVVPHRELAGAAYRIGRGRPQVLQQMAVIPVYAVDVARPRQLALPGHLASIAGPGQQR